MVFKFFLEVTGSLILPNIIPLRIYSGVPPYSILPTSLSFPTPVSQKLHQALSGISQSRSSPGPEIEWQFT